MRFSESSGRAEALLGAERILLNTLAQAGVVVTSTRHAKPPFELELRVKAGGKAHHLLARFKTHLEE